MIIAMSLNELIEIFIDPLSDHMKVRKVHRSSLYRKNLTGRDRRLIGRSIKIGKDPRLVLQDRTAIVSKKVKVSVICQVHRRIRIGKNAVSQCQRILVSQRVGDGYDGVSRIALIPVRT